MSIVVRCAAALAAAWATSVPAAPCVWYTDDTAIRQVDAATNAIAHSVALSHVGRLAMDAEDCGVWALDTLQRRLLRYGPTGTLHREVAVRALGPGIDRIDHLQLDPYDGSLWANDGRRILHLSASGALLASFAAPGEVQRLQVALDRSLWVLGKRALWRLDAAGTVRDQYSLQAHLTADARFFAVDDLGAVAWIADNDNLARIELAPQARSAPRLLRLRQPITGFALDSLGGTVWIAQADALLAYGRDMALVRTVALEPLGIRKPEKLAFDPASRSLWAGAQRSLSRFTAAGDFVAQFPARDGDEALGVPPLKVEPTLELLRPADGALTNDARPEIRVRFGARCNAGPCGFDDGHFAGYALDATLDGASIGALFLRSGLDAHFRPVERLPEGANAFAAQVRDEFGHASSTVSATFTVDTIAPAFVTLSPEDGAVFAVPEIAIEGVVDEPGARVFLEVPATAAGNPQGRAFSFPVVLEPGDNLVRLAAVDPAGNRSTVARTVVFAPGIDVRIDSPAAGAAVAGSTVLVTGTFKGPANAGVAVNGVVAGLSGERFLAQVPIAPGANVLSAAVSAPGGLRLVRSIAVTGSGPLPVEIVAESTTGLAPFAPRFSVQASAAPQRVEADFDGDGIVDQVIAEASAALAFTYAQPGLFSARFAITDAAGARTTQTLQVLVQDPAQLDLRLRAVWQAFLEALAARDRPAALAQLTAPARLRYGRVFDAIVDRLPPIAAGLSPLERSVLDATVAEYFVTRAAPDGSLRLFFVYFMLDDDGVWRLESL